MTQEEFDNLQDGDEVVLVDNIDEVNHSEWASLDKDVYTKDAVYKVDMKHTSNDSNSNLQPWVGVQLTNDGQTGHGWPMDRWDLYDPKVIDIYARLGMNQQGDESETGGDREKNIKT